MSVSARVRSTTNAALRDIQAPVRTQLDAVPRELTRIVSADLPLIEEVNSHLLRMQGKLFRPTLLLLSSATEGPPDARATTLAAVLELIHLATLVHDDSVDHSALRRGMPTINSMFSHQISVIMGDFLYTRALGALVRGKEFEALRVITDASDQMTLGEMRQLMAFDALAFSEDDYYALILAKTASLIGAACEVGALCGARAHQKALATYGQRLGMAFQIADDLLDYTADQDETGKPTGLDLREHKVTLPLIAAMRSMNPAARREVETLFATDEPSDEAIARVVEIVSEHGGLDYSRRRGEQFAAEAEEALAGLPESDARTGLLDAISYVMDRRW